MIASGGSAAEAVFAAIGLTVVLGAAFAVLFVLLRGRRGDSD